MSSYDEIPYPSEAFPFSRPSHLKVIGELFGISTKCPNVAEVLELGCGSGNNIIPLAALHPESKFIGVDSSKSQIEKGIELISELGLKNIELQPVDIKDFSATKKFDYIICHGLYSWVDRDCQHRILEICSQNLSQDGVAYISFNALPGWYLKSIVRDAMQFHTRSIKEPIKKIAEARAYLNFLAFGTEEVHGANHQIIKAVAEGVKDLPDWYFFHDYLEEENNPIYFSAFASKLAKHQLKHISDADISLFVPQEFSSEVQISLRTFSKTATYMEQTMDFLRGQSFRRAIICHKDQQLSGHPQIQPIKNFYLSAPLRLESEDNGGATFKDPFRGHTLQTKDHLFGESLKHLGNIWPASVSYPDLAKHVHAPESETEALLTLFLRAFISGSVSFDPLPSVTSDAANGNPMPFAVARALEKRGASVINYKHENILLNESCRRFLRFADGTRSSEMIAAETGLDVEIMLKLLKQYSLI